MNVVKKQPSVSIPSLFLVLMAAMQLAGVNTAGLSRWKGGGMGMYSEFHPNRTRIEQWKHDRWQPIETCDNEVTNAQRLLNASMLQAVSECLGTPRVRARKPRFNSKTLRLSYEEVLRLGP